jgi:hypothetical protein
MYHFTTGITRWLEDEVLGEDALVWNGRFLGRTCRLTSPDSLGKHTFECRIHGSRASEGFVLQLTRRDLFGVVKFNWRLELIIGPELPTQHAHKRAHRCAEPVHRAGAISISLFFRPASVSLSAIP